MEDPIVLEQILETFGVAGGLIATIVLVAQAGARLIAEDATGVKGILRKAFKILGLYNKDRQTKDDSLG